MLRPDPKEALKKIVTTLVVSGETKIQNFRQEFNTFYPLLNSPKEDFALRAKLQEDCEKVLAVAASLKDWTFKVDGHLRLRALKAQIQAIAVVFRFRYVVGDRDRDFVEVEPHRSQLTKLFSDVIAAEKWFDCKGDEECQTDLYRLYEYIVGTNVQVDCFKFLSVLVDSSDASLIKLLALQSLLEEKMRLSAKNGNRSELRLVTDKRAEFGRVLKVCLVTGDEPLSLITQLKIAKARVTAYRYHLACSHLLNAGAHKHHLLTLEGVEIFGEYNILIAAPLLNEDMTMLDFKQLIDDERRLRQAYLQPILAFIQQLTFQDLFASRDYAKLFTSILKDGSEQMNRVLGQFTAILKAVNQNKIRSTPQQKKFLSDYCQELTTHYAKWGEILSGWKTVNLTIIERGDRENKELMQRVSKYAEEHDQAVKTRVESATKAIAQQRTEFTALERRADAIKNQIETMANAQAARYAKILAAQQQTSYIPPASASDVADEVAEKRPEPTIVKSNTLARLEHLDARLFRFARLVVRNAERIQVALTERLSATQELSPGKKEFIQRKLNASLTDFQGLLRMSASFGHLSRSLPKAEKLAYQEGIAASLENFSQLRAKASELLREVSQLLTQQVTVAEMPESKTYYPQVEALESEQLAEEDVPDYQLTLSYPPDLQEIWKNVQDFPGDQRLFGDAMIGLLRPERQVRPARGALSAFHFAASCKTAGEVLDVNITFHISKYNQQQCRSNVSGIQVINLFLTGTIDKKHIPKPMFFTSDCVVGDSEGHIEELIPGSLQDIKDGTLRENPAFPLNENSEAILIAILRMSKFNMVPDLALYNAMFAWQRKPDFDFDYVEAVMAEHFKELYYDQRLKYVEFLRQFDLLNKIFGVDVGRPIEEVMRGLERLLLPAPKPIATLSLFKDIPPPSIQQEVFSPAPMPS